MKTPNITITASDDRNKIDSELTTGGYYVGKARTIKIIDFGYDSCAHKDCESAQKELTSYLASRKDSDDLNVTLIEYRIITSN